MKTGFTFDEKIIKTHTIEGFIDQLATSHYKAIEVSPEASVLPISTYKNILGLFQQANYHINYHVPYFSKYYNNENSYYDIGLFKTNKEAIIKKYESFLSIILTLRQYSVTVPDLVIHTGTFDTKTHPKQPSQDSTLFFFDWFLNFIEKRNIELNLLVETLDEKDGFVYPRSAGALSVLHEFDHPALGICWDLVHDFQYDALFKEPSDEFFNHIKHVHIHGNNLQRGQKHLPLHMGQGQFTKAMAYLKDNGYKYIINNELLINSSDQYILDLLKDDQLMRSLV